MEILNNVNLEHAIDGKSDVGITIEDDIVNITVPQAFRVENDQSMLKKDILLFLKSISLAKKINYRNRKMTNEYGGSLPIDSYVWLIYDYLENGFYYSRDTVYSTNLSGKVSWKRTLKTTPIVSNGNIIYDKLITSKKVASNDIITHIYKICLKISSKKVGWLFNFAIKIQEKQLISIKEMIVKVKSELSSTYDDNKKIRFRHMINILESVKNDALKLDKVQYTINNYYYVFEQMVDKMFNGITGDEKKKYNPTGYWNILGENNHVKASDLRPDTICKVNDETFIIDAKMYQYGCTHNLKDLPDTQSLQKQVRYGEFVFNKIDVGGKVRNAFILPYNKELSSFKNDKNIIRYDNSNIVYIGEGYIDATNKNDEKDYERIFAFMIDFNYLLKNYKKSNDILTILVDKINELLERKSE